MTIKDLCDNFNSMGLSNETEVHIVAANFSAGGDTFAPLDTIKVVNGHLLIGTSEMMCGDEATPLNE